MAFNRSSNFGVKRKLLLWFIIYISSYHSICYVFVLFGQVTLMLSKKTRGFLFKLYWPMVQYRSCFYSMTSYINPEMFWKYFFKILFRYRWFSGRTTSCLSCGHISFPAAAKWLNLVFDFNQRSFKRRNWSWSLELVIPDRDLWSKLPKFPSIAQYSFTCFSHLTAAMLERPSYKRGSIRSIFSGHFSTILLLWCPSMVTAFELDYKKQWRI